MIIGLLGKSRVGKDTVAHYLTQLIGENDVSIVRLSQPLKDAACSLYGFTHEQVEGPAKELIVHSLDMTPRQCIQKLCTFLMQQHGEGFFSQRVFQKYDMHCMSTPFVIIPDIRFAKDIAEIQQRGGLVVKISRKHEGVPQHAWEDLIEYMHGDIHIENNTTVEELHRKVRQLYEDFIKT